MKHVCMVFLMLLIPNICLGLAQSRIKTTPDLWWQDFWEENMRRNNNGMLIVESQLGCFAFPIQYSSGDTEVALSEASTDFVSSLPEKKGVFLSTYLENYPHYLGDYSYDEFATNNSGLSNWAVFQIDMGPGGGSPIGDGFGGGGGAPDLQKKPACHQTGIFRYMPPY